ncbi:MAG: hypothetical protein QXQ69_02975 [Candidatus Aenigmatarchaeota archaeon]
MPFGLIERLRRKDSSEEFSKIEKTEYKSILNNLLNELYTTVKNWKKEISERGYIPSQQEKIYLQDLMTTTRKASRVAFNLGDQKLQDLLLSLYVNLKKLPSAKHVETVKEIEKAVEKIMEHYRKKHKIEEEKLKSEIPGIFVVLLISFLLFLFVSYGSFSSGYFVKPSDLISISLVFSFLLAFSVILLLRNL